MRTIVPVEQYRPEWEEEKPRRQEALDAARAFDLGYSLPAAVWQRMAETLDSCMRSEDDRTRVNAAKGVIAAARLEFDATRDAAKNKPPEAIELEIVIGNPDGPAPPSEDREAE